MTNGIGLDDIDALLGRPIYEIRAWFKSKIQQIVANGEPTTLVVEPCVTSTGSATYRVIFELKADAIIANGLTEQMDPYEADRLFRDSLRVLVGKQGRVIFKGPELRGKELEEYGGVENFDGHSFECVPLEGLLPEDVDAELVRTYEQCANRPRRYFIPRTTLVDEILENPIYVGA